nr:MAG TPA: hypothetical protein [Caudoviricetes sp.]
MCPTFCNSHHQARWVLALRLNVKRAICNSLTAAFMIQGHSLPFLQGGEKVLAYTLCIIYN